MQGRKRKIAVPDALAARLFRALCDPNRLALLGKLARCRRPCTVSEMAACCPVDLSVVSRHLATLREAGVLEAHKRGREVRYSVRARWLSDALRSLADTVDNCCPPEEKRT